VHQDRRISVLSNDWNTESMQVTQEDGGRLNAFAKEPRMQVMEAGEGSAGSSKVLLISGGLLVLLMLAVAVGIS
jgi:hypothetical protein